jgi:hypothetical protein
MDDSGAVLKEALAQPFMFEIDAREGVTTLWIVKVEQEQRY